jgi:WD40 repeat protein
VGAEQGGEVGTQQSQFVRVADNRIYQHNQMTPRLLHTCTGHRAALYALAPGRTPDELLSAGGDGWVVAWDLRDPDIGKVIANVQGQVFSMCHLVDRSLLVLGDMLGGVYWIDLRDTTLVKGVQYHKKGVYAFCPLDNGSLLSLGGDGMLSRWDPTTQRVTEGLHLSNKALRSVTFHAATRTLAVGDSNGHIFLLDADSLALRHRIESAHANSVFALAFYPDGKRLLSGGRDAMLRAWNLEHGTPSKEHELPAHWYTINDITFSPDGAHFATASRDKTFKIWESATLRLLKVADTLRSGTHNHSVNRLLWPSDHLLATCSDDRSMMLWQI